MLRALLALSAGCLLLSCTANVNTSPADQRAKIIPTTGEFTEAAEAFYQKRYDISVEAFQSGRGTTDYDTEIYFGQSLKPRPLPRGKSIISQSALTELTAYAEQHNSDSFMIYSFINS